MVRKFVLSTMLALAVSVGVVTTASAWDVGIGSAPKKPHAATRTAPPQPPSVFS